MKAITRFLMIANPLAFAVLSVLWLRMNPVMSVFWAVFAVVFTVWAVAMRRLRSGIATTERHISDLKAILEDCRAPQPDIWAQHAEYLRECNAATMRHDFPEAERWLALAGKEMERIKKEPTP